MVNKIKIYKNFEILKKHQNAMILIGNFDGLHLGHQKLFKEAKKYKKKYNSKIGVVTFDPIPMIKVLRIIDFQILIKRADILVIIK